MNKIAFDASDLKSLVQVSSPYLAGDDDTVASIINTIINYVFPAAGIAVLIYLLIGGYQIMLSGGNPKNIEQGKSKITNAIVGFIIIFVAYWLVQAIANILGLKTITEEVITL